MKLFRILGIPIVVLYWLSTIIGFTILCILDFESPKDLNFINDLSDILQDWLNDGIYGLCSTNSQSLKTLDRIKEILIQTKEFEEMCDVNEDILSTHLDENKKPVNNKGVLYSSTLQFILWKKQVIQRALSDIKRLCLTHSNSNNHDIHETVYKQILDIINKSEEV